MEVKLDLLVAAASAGVLVHSGRLLVLLHDEYQGGQDLGVASGLTEETSWVS